MIIPYLKAKPFTSLLLALVANRLSNTLQNLSLARTRATNLLSTLGIASYCASRPRPPTQYISHPSISGLFAQALVANVCRTLVIPLAVYNRSKPSGIGVRWMTLAEVPTSQPWDMAHSLLKASLAPPSRRSAITSWVAVAVTVMRRVRIPVTPSWSPSTTTSPPSTFPWSSWPLIVSSSLADASSLPGSACPHSTRTDPVLAVLFCSLRPRNS
ncbi:hypothetical protein D9619_007600 [Psilocybe cf. subviscida]|uniref:Uncharacterized protein n=1 Tax=Psilocybe cf. subviscida TaxID=2480587 RepID=A0A8H5B2Y3_9AGAR|nr:hypothetical protein D9619_007600 [Psilocybe cf. subviscida]